MLTVGGFAGGAEEHVRVLDGNHRERKSIFCWNSYK